MPVDTYQSVEFMIDQFLAWEGITPSGTAPERADALTKLNLAYQDFLRGTYLDERGEQFFHNWSFLHETEADLEFALDTREKDLPNDFMGIIEDIVFMYDAGGSSKSGADLTRISAHQMLTKIRDNNTSGIPTEWCIRLKSSAVGTGSVYQLLVNPAPDVAMKVYIRYRFKPPALADSSSQYPVGPIGSADCIVQIAKAREERTRGQTEGPEWREARRLLDALVRLDKDVVPEAQEQESLSEAETGMSV
ncbi:MAG: hypothetical protein AMS14_10860 [Planctomycetes bacterium DG_20]|nr:MAG: hypothetical protein AMS14_10860 [Planctomycetes bacterium DG_20]